MHIKFQSIEYKNFLSVGNSPVSIDFTKTGSTLCVGQNGEGKSTLIDALCFVLYGKAFRKVKKGDLVNNINNKNLHVKVKFQISGKQYIVERGIKPNIFTILCDGKKIENDSSNIDFQRELEFTILKMNIDTFRQVVVLGSRSFVPFMKATKSVKQSIIEDLLDIQIFSKMLIVLRQKYNEFKRDLKDVEHSKKLIENSIELTQNHLTKIIEKNNMILEQAEDEEKTYLHEVNNLESQKIQLLEKLKEVTDSLRLTEIEEGLQKLRTKTQSLYDLNSELQKEIEFFENNDICPTCDQHIDENQKSYHIDANKTQQNELEKRINHINSTHTKLKEKLETEQKKQEKVRKISQYIDGIDRKISVKKQAFESKHKIKYLETEEYEEKIKGYEKDLKEVQKKHTGLIDTIQEFLLIQDIVNETGLKSQIIKTYIPIINKLIVKYLQLLEFNVTFTFDEFFNDHLRMRGKEETTYYNLSEGQQLRIDLCLLFVFRDVSKIKNSTSTNLLILDEIGDSSLDNEGFEGFLKMMADSASKGNNIFIISHNADLQSTNQLERTIVFKKVNNFTEIEED